MPRPPTRMPPRAIRPERIVLWGESLGTGVAVALAAEKPVGRVILQSPFTSTADIAAARYWFVPVRLLMKDQFHSDQRIGKVTAPVLVMHGDQDGVVPFALGRAALCDGQITEDGSCAFPAPGISTSARMARTRRRRNSSRNPCRDNRRPHPGRASFEARFARASG